MTTLAQPRSTVATSLRTASSLVLFLLSIVPFALAFDNVAQGQDEGLLLAYPMRVLAGDVPYRDFEHLYGPGTVGTLAMVYAVTGPSVVVERTIGLLYRLAIVLAVWNVARQQGERCGLMSAFLSSLLLALMGPAAYAFLAGLALGLWSVWFLLNSRYRLAGLAAGLALVFRADLLVAVLPSALVLLYGTRRSSWLQYMQGLLIGTLPYLALLVWLGPMLLIDSFFIAPVLRIGPARRLPLGEHIGWLLAVAVPSLLLILCALRAARNKRRYLLALGVFAIGLLPYVTQRADVNHWASVASVSIALLPTVYTNVPLHQRLRGFLAPVALIVVAFLYVTVTGIAWVRQGTLVYNGARSFPIAGEQAAQVQAVVNDIVQTAQPGERLFVGTRDLQRTFLGDTFFYYLIPELAPASYYLEMNPGSANRQGSRLADDITTADILILSRLYERPVDPAQTDNAWLLKEPDLAWAAGDSRAREVVEEQFCLQAKHGPYEIFTRCQP